MFLSKYTSLLTQNPIATTLISVCVLVAAIHIITPIVCASGNVFKRYWSRGKLGTSNAYFNWCGEITMETQEYIFWGSSKYTLTERDGKWCFMNRTWFAEIHQGRVYDFHGSEVANTHHLKDYIFFGTKEDALKAISSKFTWERWLISLFIGAAITLGACLSGLLLDFLVFNHLLQTIVVFAIAAGIWGTLAGGRMMYDLNEKVAVIDNAAKEIKQD